MVKVHLVARLDSAKVQQAISDASLSYIIIYKQCAYQCAMSVGSRPPPASVPLPTLPISYRWRGFSSVTHNGNASFGSLGG